MEVQLSDTGLIIKEHVLGSKQVFVCQTFIGGLQGAENKRSHHQVKYDPCQQGQEGGAPHFLPVDPPAPPPGLGVKAYRPGPGQDHQHTGHRWPQTGSSFREAPYVCKHRNVYKQHKSPWRTDRYFHTVASNQTPDTKSEKLEQTRCTPSFIPLH